jgi:hypothetical protein
LTLFARALSAEEPDEEAGAGDEPDVPHDSEAEGEEAGAALGAGDELPQFLDGEGDGDGEDGRDAGEDEGRDDEGDDGRDAVGAASSEVNASSIDNAGVNRFILGRIW